MKEIIDKAEKAYKAREQAKAQMQELKKDAEREQDEFQNEWNKLGKLIEKDKQVKDFIQTQEEKKVSQPKGKPTENVNEIQNTEKTLTHTCVQAGFQIARQTSNIQSTMSKVAEYEEAFNSIKTATKLNDIEQLVNEFEKAEKHNFSLFTYVKDLTAEMDDLEEEISKIKEEIDKYKGQGVNNENNREKILKKLNAELEATENETKEYEQQYKETIKTINALKIGIQSIFDRIGCNNESV